MQETQVQSLGWEDRSPGEGSGNLFQYSFLGNPKDRGVSGGLQSMGCKRVGHNLVTEQQKQKDKREILTPWKM